MPIETFRHSLLRRIPPPWAMSVTATDKHLASDSVSPRWCCDSACTCEREAVAKPLETHPFSDSLLALRNWHCSCRLSWVGSTVDEGHSESRFCRGTVPCRVDGIGGLVATEKWQPDYRQV